MELENPFYQNVIAALNDNIVNYILIGGLAVGFHGYSRYTGDMDLWVEPSNDNMDRLYRSLLKMGYSSKLVAKIKDQRDVNNPTPIKLWDDSNTFKVDLMTNTFQDEFSWEQCREHSNIININENAFPVIHINHLITMKRNAKRLDNSLKDLVDAEELSKIRRNLKK